jgi:hypothetical protein
MVQRDPYRDWRLPPHVYIKPLNSLSLKLRATNNGSGATKTGYTLNGERRLPQTQTEYNISLNKS